MKKFLFLLLLFLSILSCSKAKYYVQLSIYTYPENVKVYVDNNYVGKSPLDNVKVGILTEKGTPVVIRAEKDFYFPQSEVWTDTSKKNTKIEYNIILNPGIADYKGVFSDPKYEVTFDQLFTKNEEELKIYKYEVSAKYGASIPEKEIQNYFEKTTWYKKNPDFKDDVLNSADKFNIKAIEAFLKALGNTKKDTASIFNNVEYRSSDRSLQFVSEDKVLETGQSTNVGYSSYNAPYFNPPKSWYSFGSLIFVEQVADYFNVYLIDHSTRKIEWYKEQVKLDTNSQARLINSPAVFTRIDSSGYNKEPYDRNIYHPVKAFDGKVGTAWLENSTGFGEGAAISFELDHLVIIDEVRIKAGYFDPQYYATNNRLKKASLYYQDANDVRSATQNLSFKDVMEEQSFTLSPTFMQSFVLYIEDAYIAEGQEWNDTAISEISFYYKGKRIEIGLGEFSVFTEVDPK